MQRNKIDDAVFREIAQEGGLQVTEVRRAVNSFFGVIVRESRALPFDTERKIYSKDKFDEFVNVRNIPSVGRIGPVYSRYLKWRGNEAKNQKQVDRSLYRSRVPQSEIESMAEDILAGKTPQPVTKRKGYELYNRIWMVGKVGKKLARQVIPKEE